MRRRTFLAASAGLLARPVLAAQARVLRFVPDSNLASIDPVWNVIPVTRNHGMMVWDMLYGRDADFIPPAADGRRPRTVAGRAELALHPARRAAVPRRHTCASFRLASPASAAGRSAAHSASGC